MPDEDIFGRQTPEAGDAELFGRYVENRSENAFAMLVRRHLDAVYSSALRRVGGDTHLAEDVAQQVFVALARKAGSLAVHPHLTGWLYRTTRNEAANVVRRERRRKAREQEAHAMHDFEARTATDRDWTQVAPVLDKAIDQLSESDRIAVLLRFVDRRGFAEIGAALRLKEDAARMRVERALGKLQALLAERGITSTAAALALTLASQAVAAAPFGLAGNVTSAAMAANGGTLLNLISFMSTTKFTIAVATAALLMTGVAFHEVRTARKAREALAATSGEYGNALGRRRDFEARSRVADEELALLRRKLDAIQAAKAAEGQRPARTAVAPATDPGSDPIAAGKAFLAAHPEVRKAVVARSRARIAARFFSLYAALQLAPDQIARLEDLLIESEGLSMHYPQTGSMLLAPGTGMSREAVERELRSLLGDQGYRRYQEANRMVDVEWNITIPLASSLFLTDDPLTARQAEQLGKIIMRLEPNQKPPLVWEPLMREAANILSAPQLLALDHQRQQVEFPIMMKKLTNIKRP